MLVKEPVGLVVTLVRALVESNSYYVAPLYSSIPQRFKEEKIHVLTSKMVIRLVMEGNIGSVRGRYIGSVHERHTTQRIRCKFAD